MKITINIDENLPDLEIVINGNSLSAQIETIIATLRMLDSQMTVTRDGESYILDVAKIVYIESVDRKTFVYTCEDCGETKKEVLKKTAHTLGDWVLILAPSVDDAGLERATCTKCNYYEERTVEKLEAAYYITVDEGNGKVFLMGITEDGKYALNQPEKIGYNFVGWVDANGKNFAASGTVKSDVQVSAKWELDGTDSLAELIERAAAGVDRINITKNITVTEPIFVSCSQNFVVRFPVWFFAPASSPVFPGRVRRSLRNFALS